MKYRTNMATNEDNIPVYEEGDIFKENATGRLYLLREKDNTLTFTRNTLVSRTKMFNTTNTDLTDNYTYLGHLHVGENITMYVLRLFSESNTLATEILDMVIANEQLNQAVTEKVRIQRQIEELQAELKAQTLIAQRRQEELDEATLKAFEMINK